MIWSRPVRIAVLVMLALTLIGLVVMLILQTSQQFLSGFLSGAVLALVNFYLLVEIVARLMNKHYKNISGILPLLFAKLLAIGLVFFGSVVLLQASVLGLALGYAVLLPAVLMGGLMPFKTV